MRVKVCQGMGFFDPPRVVSAGSVLGIPVATRGGEPLGIVEELVLDADEGRVAYAVLVLGPAELADHKRIPIPWKALKLMPEDGGFVVEVSRELVEEAPGLERVAWSRVTERQWLSDLYRHYGYTPYWK